MDNLDKRKFPKFPDGNIFTAYKVNGQAIIEIEFDCIRYQNLLRDNKIVSSKVSVVFSMPEAIEKHQQWKERLILCKEQARAKVELKRQGRSLSLRETDILIFFYGLNLTISAIAKIYNFSYERTDRIRHKGLRKMQITSSKKSNADQILEKMMSSPNLPIAIAMNSKTKEAICQHPATKIKNGDIDIPIKNLDLRIIVLDKMLNDTYVLLRSQDNINLIFQANESYCPDMGFDFINWLNLVKASDIIDEKFPWKP